MVVLREKISSVHVEPKLAGFHVKVVYRNPDISADDLSFSTLTGVIEYIGKLLD